jgi:hypothetical protein
MRSTQGLNTAPAVSQDIDMSQTTSTSLDAVSKKTASNDSLPSLIFVKENVCEDMNGQPREFLDEEDSSLTR